MFLLVVATPRCVLHGEKYLSFFLASNFQFSIFNSLPSFFFRLKNILCGVILIPVGFSFILVQVKTAKIHGAAICPGN